MTQRIVSVGDDFALPAGTKVLDTHLPTRLGSTALNATYAPASVAATKLDKTEAAATYALKGEGGGETGPAKLLQVGDSLTENWGNSSNNAEIVTAFGSGNVLSIGKGGQTSAMIAARQGGVPALLTVSGGVIPASGSVGVTVSPNLFYMNAATGNWSQEGTLAGVAGTLSLVKTTGGVYTYTFARTSAGASVATPAPVPFKTGQDWRDRVMTIAIGRNNFKTSTPESIVAEIRNVIEWSRVDPSKHIVLSIPAMDTETPGTADRTSLDAANAAIKAAFPRQFVDWVGYLTSANTLTQAGVTPTATDTQNIADGITPLSFRGDNLHFNGLAYDMINTLILREFSAREVITGWTEPGGPPAPTLHSYGLTDAAHRYAGVELPDVGSLATPWPDAIGSVDLALATTVLKVEAGPGGVEKAAYTPNVASTANTQRVYNTSGPNSTRTIAVVYNNRTAATATHDLVSVGGGWLKILRGANGNIAASVTGITVPVQDSSSNVAGWRIGFAWYDEATGELGLDTSGTEVLTTFTRSAAPSTTLSIGGGASAALDMGVAEVLLWDRVLTDAERSTVRTALKAHFPAIP